MTEMQIDRLINAVEGLTAAFDRAARPVVIVTADAENYLVNHYQKNGYPIYFMDNSRQTQPASDVSLPRLHHG